MLLRLLLLLLLLLPLLLRLNWLSKVILLLLLLPLLLLPLLLLLVHARRRIGSRQRWVPVSATCTREVINGKSLQHGRQKFEGSSSFQRATREQHHLRQLPYMLLRPTAQQHRRLAAHSRRRRCCSGCCCCQPLLRFR